MHWSIYAFVLIVVGCIKNVKRLMDGPGQLVNHRCARATARWKEYNEQEDSKPINSFEPPELLNYKKAKKVVKNDMWLFKPNLESVVPAGLEITMSYTIHTSETSPYKDTCDVHNKALNKRYVQSLLEVPPLDDNAPKKYVELNWRLRKISESSQTTSYWTSCYWRGCS
jgi:hypothetical protein